VEYFIPIRLHRAVSVSRFRSIFERRRYLDGEMRRAGQIPDYNGLTLGPDTKRLVLSEGVKLFRGEVLGGVRSAGGPFCKTVVL